MRVLPIQEQTEDLNPGTQFFNLGETFTLEHSRQLVPATEMKASREGIWAVNAAATVSEQTDDFATSGG